MGQRIVLTRSGTERFFDLALGEEALIARSVEARLLLWHPSISRNHCKLRATAAGIEVDNVSGKTTCTVNGQRVLPRAMLIDGDVLQVGTLAFSVKCLDPPPSTCSKCGKPVATGEARVTTDGTLICVPCVARSSAASEVRPGSVLERLGCVVLEELGGDPPSFRVERPDRHVNNQFQIAKIIEIPEERPEVLKALREEATALAWIDHPAVAAILEMEEVEGRLVVFYPESHGKPLDEIVQRSGPLSPEIALACARVCADAIEHVAQRHVLHKDVTPTNVLLDVNGNVTLTGFSGARQLGNFSLLSRSFAASELGPLLYWAPELVTGEPEADSRADVFGIGAVLLYGLVARPPWGGNVMPSQHMVQLLNGVRPPIVLAGVPAPLVPILNKLLAVVPSERPSPTAAVALLDQALLQIQTP